jgi:hypothetical protein
LFDDFEIVRWHCKGKKAHKAKAAHKAHGCTPAKSKPVKAKIAVRKKHP